MAFDKNQIKINLDIDDETINNEESKTSDFSINFGEELENNEDNENNLLQDNENESNESNNINDLLQMENNSQEYKKEFNIETEEKKESEKNKINFTKINILENIDDEGLKVNNIDDKTKDFEIFKNHKKRKRKKIIFRSVGALSIMLLIVFGILFSFQNDNDFVKNGYDKIKASIIGNKNNENNENNDNSNSKISGDIGNTDLAKELDKLNKTLDETYEIIDDKDREIEKLKNEIKNLEDKLLLTYDSVEDIDGNNLSIMNEENNEENIKQEDDEENIKQEDNQEMISFDSLEIELDENIDYETSVIVRDVNMRQKPWVKGNWIKIVKKEEKIKIIEKRNIGGEQWILVENNGDIGWIHSIGLTG